MAFQPEIVLTFGGMIVSKRIKAFLRRYRPEHHWHVDPLRAYDTFGRLTRHFEAYPNDFFQQFLPFVKTVESTYASEFEKLSDYRKERHDRFVATAPFSDFSVFALLMRSMPKNVQLQIANSAPIRYAQLFGTDASVEVFCNRGTSGIDGSTSTAIGAAVGSGKPVVLVTGDVGFFYDSNALWNNYIPKDFKIIIVNNGGGGIFRILPGHQENKTFNTFFETAHNLTAECLAQMFRMRYFSANDAVSLQDVLPGFYGATSPSILEIFTPTKENDKVLAEYFRFLG
jgi:2-succinyl-5-enolpyruvyl-6-hydroxy-3-cyclohexene-1-carboxylate synthase